MPRRRGRAADGSEDLERKRCPAADQDGDQAPEDDGRGRDVRSGGVRRGRTGSSRLAPPGAASPRPSCPAVRPLRRRPSAPRRLLRSRSGAGGSWSAEGASPPCRVTILARASRGCGVPRFRTDLSVGPVVGRPRAEEAARFEIRRRRHACLGGVANLLARHVDAGRVHEEAERDRAFVDTEAPLAEVQAWRVAPDRACRSMGKARDRKSRSGSRPGAEGQQQNRKPPQTSDLVPNVEAKGPASGAALAVILDHRTREADCN